MVSSPSVPAPSTTTVSPSVIGWRRAAWTAQAAGSTITAASSLMSSGGVEGWLGWATMWVLQPPPVSQQ